MPFPFHINILDLLLKGVAIGILVSAPMGPVGVLCVQRTLNKGRWFGFVTGIGACVSDFIYALITGLGMSFVMDFISNSHYRYILQISASIILMIFGIYSFRSNPMKVVISFMACSVSGLTGFFCSRSIITPYRALKHVSISSSSLAPRLRSSTMKGNTL
jgi:arginine exporter protein ArgO